MGVWFLTARFRIEQSRPMAHVCWSHGSDGATYKAIHYKIAIWCGSLVSKRVAAALRSRHGQQCLGEFA